MGGDRGARHRCKELLYSLEQELRSDYGLDPRLPWNSAGAIKELVKVDGVETAHQHQDPVGDAQPQICSANSAQVGTKFNPSVADAGIGVPQSAQFARNNGLKPKCGGGDKRNCRRL